MFRDFPTFSRTWIFFLLLFYSSTLLLFLFSLTLSISAFHLSILSEVWLLNFLRQIIKLKFHMFFKLWIETFLWRINLPFNSCPVTLGLSSSIWYAVSLSSQAGYAWVAVPEPEPAKRRWPPGRVWMDGTNNAKRKKTEKHLQLGKVVFKKCTHISLSLFSWPTLDIFFPSHHPTPELPALVSLVHNGALCKPKAVNRWLLQLVRGTM